LLFLTHKYVQFSEAPLYDKLEILLSLLIFIIYDLSDKENY